MRTNPRRSPSPNRALRIALIAALLIAASGYAWTQIDHDPPDATWRTLELDVDGLDCAFWCSVKVSTAIDEMPGAKVDHVDSGAGTVHLRYDPQRREVDDVVRAVEDKGFAVTGVADTGTSPDR